MYKYLLLWNFTKLFTIYMLVLPSLKFHTVLHKMCVSACFFDNYILDNKYILDAKTIILGELRGKYKLLNIILLANKMEIYSNRNKTSRLILDQVKLVIRDLFQIEKYWAEANDKLQNFLGFWHPLYNELINL